RALRRRGVPLPPAVHRRVPAAGALRRGDGRRRPHRAGGRPSHVRRGVPLRGHAEEGVTMDAFVVDAARALAASGAPLVSVTVPAPVVPIERAARVPLPGPILRWDAPAPEAGGRAFSFAGFGEAACIEAGGEDRFDRILPRGEALFADLAELVH